MVDDIYAADERRLLEAWFSGMPLPRDDKELLAEWGFDNDLCSGYTRLDAWVGAFAVKDIQERLPNCGICHDDGVVLTRPIAKGRRSKRVAGAVRFLFQINWADTAPGVSWPADYHLVWMPGFDRWVLTCSSDSDDAKGYCDFALGSVGPDDDWRNAMRRILFDNWRFQISEWHQRPWAYVWRAGLVSRDEAMAWRAEAWPDDEESDDEWIEDDDADQDEKENDLELEFE